MLSEPGGENEINHIVALTTACIPYVESSTKGTGGSLVKGND